MLRRRGGNNGGRRAIGSDDSVGAAPASKKAEVVVVQPKAVEEREVSVASVTDMRSPEPSVVELHHSPSASPLATPKPGAREYENKAPSYGGAGPSSPKRFFSPEPISPEKRIVDFLTLFEDAFGNIPCDITEAWGCVEAAEYFCREDGPFLGQIQYIKALILFVLYPDDEVHTLEAEELCRQAIENKHEEAKVCLPAYRVLAAGFSPSRNHAAVVAAKECYSHLVSQLYKLLPHSEVSGSMSKFLKQASEKFPLSLPFHEDRLIFDIKRAIISPLVQSVSDDRLARVAL